MQPPLPAIPAAVRTALELVEGTPDKYVPMPSAKMVLNGHVEMLQAFQPRVRNQAEKVRLREVTRSELEEEGKELKSNKNATHSKIGDKILSWSDPADKTEEERNGLGSNLYD